MSTLWRCLQKTNTVRPRSAGGIPVVWCVLAFAVTALVVYGLGRRQWQSTEIAPTYTATAFVVENSQPGCPFVYTSEDPQRATNEANDLADRYAADRRSQWQSGMISPCQNAHDATLKAQQNYEDRKAQLETFDRQQRPLPDERAVSPQQNLPSPLIENPKWLDAGRQLADLRRQRDQLLVKLTPLHPSILEIDGRIAEAQSRLAAIPPQIPGAAREPAAIVPSSVEVAAAKNLEINRNREALASAVEQSRLALEQCELAEQQLLQAKQTGPQLIVQYAQSVQQNSPPIEDIQQGSMWPSLLAGLLMAFGVGTFGFGLGIEPPLASLAEVEADLDEPVLGSIPSEGPKPDVAAIRRQKQWREATMTIGACLMAACVGAAIWGMGG